MTMTNDMRSERVDLRLTPDAKRLLQQAAAAANTTLTEFLIRSGLMAAADTLANRRTFVLEEARWAEFVAELDRPPADNPGLRRLLERRPAWDA